MSDLLVVRVLTRVFKCPGISFPTRTLADTREPTVELPALIPIRRLWERVLDCTKTSRVLRKEARF